MINVNLRVEVSPLIRGILDKYFERASIEAKIVETGEEEVIVDVTRPGRAKAYSYCEKDDTCLAAYGALLLTHLLSPGENELIADRPVKVVVRGMLRKNVDIMQMLNEVHMIHVDGERYAEIVLPGHLVTIMVAKVSEEADGLSRALGYAFTHGDIAFIASRDRGVVAARTARLGVAAVALRLEDGRVVVERDRRRVSEALREIIEEADGDATLVSYPHTGFTGLYGKLPLSFKAPTPSSDDMLASMIERLYSLFGSPRHYFADTPVVAVDALYLADADVGHHENLAEEMKKMLDCEPRVYEHNGVYYYGNVYMTSQSLIEAVEELVSLAEELYGNGGSVRCTPSVCTCPPSVDPVSLARLEYNSRETPISKLIRLKRGASIEDVMEMLARLASIDQTCETIVAPREYIRRLASRPVIEKPDCDLAKLAALLLTLRGLKRR